MPELVLRQYRGSKDGVIIPIFKWYTLIGLNWTNHLVG